MPLLSLPFPPVPASLGQRFQLGRLRLYGLTGCVEAVDVDFSDADLPRLVTRVLEACTADDGARRVAPEFFWALSVGSRLACLLEIASLGESREATRQFRCAAGSCAELLEVEVPLRKIAQWHRSLEPRESLTVELKDRTLRVRLPTGADQRALAGQPEADAATLMRRLLPADAASLPLTADDLARVEDALAQADPLVDFCICAVCPSCGRELKQPVDLQELTLRLLRAHQQTLLDSIHALASTYHWTERDIVTMPSWRREHYLRLLEREAG
jgi:hypothetical protein